MSYGENRSSTYALRTSLGSHYPSVDNLKRATHDFWHNPKSSGYGADSTSITSRSFSISANADTTATALVSSRKFDRPDISGVRHSLDVGFTVEDVTDNMDIGYDGDIEVQLPDGYTENNTEDDSDSEGDLHRSLTDQFRQLSCAADTAENPRRRGGIKSRSHWMNPLKRPHSESLTSDSHAETSNEPPSGARRQRRRLRRMHDQLSYTVIPARDPDFSTSSNRMDLDTEQPLNRFGEL